MTLNVGHFSPGFSRNFNCGSVTLVICRRHVFLFKYLPLFPKQNLICVMWSDLPFLKKDSSPFFPILDVRDEGFWSLIFSDKHALLHALQQPHTVSPVKGTLLSYIGSYETSPLKLTIKVSCLINDSCKAFDLVSANLFSSTSRKRNVSQWSK